MWIQAHLKGGSTIRSLLVAPKDMDNITQKTGVAYRHKCEIFKCEEKYIW